MCNAYKCARFMLYFYVGALWGSFPLVFDVCNRLSDVSTCLYNIENVTCGECFNYTYSWHSVSVTLAIIYVMHLFVFTLGCIFMMYKRYRMWRRGSLNDQFYRYVSH